MYVISFVGGLWVLGRFGRGWRFDRERLAFVPRDEPAGGNRADRPSDYTATDRSDP